MNDKFFSTQSMHAVNLLNAWLFDETVAGPPDINELLTSNDFNFYKETLGLASDDQDILTTFMILLTFEDGSQCGLVLRDTAREVWSVLY